MSGNLDVGTVTGKVQFDLATTALTEAVTKLAEVATALTRVGDRSKESGSAVESAYRKLAASLDPVVAGQQKYERAQQTLDAALAKGLITQDQYTLALDRAREKFTSTEQNANSLRAKLDELAHSVQGFGENLNELGEKFESVKSFSEGLLEKVLELAAVIGAGLSLDKIIEDTVASQDAQAQLAAGLKSVGAATGETREKLEALTNSLAENTKYAKTTIERAESLGLTFTHISADAFPRFLQAAADIAARTGEDLPAAVEKLGRALDTGMVTPLKRAGITFDQTAQAQAKFFAETGQYSKEISLVLGVVESKLAGSAEAARNTLGGALQLLRNEFEEVAISIGTQISPALVALTKEIEELSRSDQFKTLAADLGATLVTGIHLLGGALEFLATHLEAVKEIVASILILKLALWLREVAEAEALAAIASLDLSRAFEAFQLLGVAGGFKYLSAMIGEATVALRAFVAQAIAAAAPFLALGIAVAGAAYAIRQYTLEQQAASEAMLKQLSLMGQTRAMLVEAREAIESVTRWQEELDRARAAGDPSRIAAAERNLGEAHKLVTQELKDRIQATGSALVAELALAQADLDHAKQLAGQKVFYPAGPQRDAAILGNKDVQDALGRVNNLQQNVKKLGDEYIALSKIPVVSEKQKEDVVHFAAHFNSASQAVQAYADKIFDLTNKLADQGANESKLLSALSQGEIAYNLQKAALERSNAIEQTAIEIKKAHRDLIEKLTAEVDKAKAALSEKHGVDQAASAAIREGNAALADAKKNYDATLASLSALAAKNVDWAQSEKQRLFLLQDDRAAQSALDAENAKLADAIGRTTLATQAHAVQLDVERVLLAASKLGIQDLDGAIEANVRARDAQTNSLRAQIDVRRQINALADQTANIRAQIGDWQEQRDAVAKYGAEIAGILKQYGLLSRATQERRAQEAYLQEFEKTGDLAQAKRLYDAIKSQQEIVNGLRAVQAATDIAARHYKDFADQLAQNYAGIFADFVKTGKLSLASFETATVDAFASVAEKIIQGWLTRWFEAMAEWLVRWIATQAAASAASASLGNGSGGGNSSTGGLSAGNLFSLGRAGYGAYTGYMAGYSPTGGVLAGWSGGVGVNGGGSYAATGSSLGSGAGAVAGWIAVIAILSIAIDKLNSHFQKTAESVITLDRSLDVGLIQKGQGQHVAGLVAAGEQLAALIRQFFSGYGAIFESLDASIAIKKRGRGGNTEWKVYVDGVMQSFGKDMDAALNYALIQSIKHSSSTGLDPLAQAAIRDYAGKDAQEFKSQVDFAERVATQNLPQLGAQVKAALTQYLTDLQEAHTIFANDAKALAEATASINQKLSDTISGLKNNVLGFDTSASDFLKGIVAFQSQVSQAGDALRQQIQQQVDDTQRQIKDLGTGPRTSAGMDSEEKAQAQKDWDDRIGALREKIKEYTDQLDAIPKALSEQEVGMAVFQTLFGFIKDSAELSKKYAADALKYAQMKIDLEFQEIKLQLIALDMWDKYAQMWTDAYNTAMQGAQDAITGAKIPGRGGAGSGSTRAQDKQSLADFLAAFNHAQLNAYHQALDDINKRYADATKLAHGDAAAIAQLNANRQKEIDQLRANTRAQIEQNINPLIAAGQGISAAQQSLDAAIKQEIADAAAYRQAGGAAWKVHLAYAEKYREMGQAAIASLNLPLESLRARFDALGGTLAFLANNLNLLGLSAEDFARVAHEVGTQEFVAIADSLAQWSTDAQDAIALNQLKWDLERAQLIAQVAMLEALDAQYHILGAGMKDMLDRLVAGLPTTVPAGFGNSGATNFTDAATVQRMAADRQAEAASVIDQAAQAFADSTQKLIDYQRSLTISPELSPLTPDQQRAEALRQLQSTFSAALGGNIDARNSFSGIADAFLRLAKSVDPSSLGYGVDFQLVQDMLARLIGQTRYLVPGTNNVTAGAFGGAGGVGTGSGTGSGYGSSSPTAFATAAPAIDLSPVVVSIQSGSNRNHDDLGALAVEVRGLRTTVADQQGKLARLVSLLDRRPS